MKYDCSFIQYSRMAIFVYVVSTVQSAPSPYDKCGTLSHINCTINYVPEPNETVCCSDRNTYDNLCFFAQAKCADLSLEVIHTGPCESTTPSPGDRTTASPVGTTEDPTLDVIHTVFCTNSDQISCGDHLDPICGSDDLFYKNDCEFAKAKCKYPTLTAQELNVCKTARRVRRSLFLV